MPLCGAFAPLRYARASLFVAGAIELSLFGWLALHWSLVPR